MWGIWRIKQDRADGTLYYVTLSMFVCPGKGELSSVLQLLLHSGKAQGENPDRKSDIPML